MTGRTLLCALYLAVGLGWVIGLLIYCLDGAERKGLANDWYRLTGSRWSPTAVIALVAVLVFCFWPINVATYYWNREDDER